MRLRLENQTLRCRCCHHSHTLDVQEVLLLTKHVDVYKIMQWKHGHGPKRTGGVAFWLLLRKTPYQAAARRREGPEFELPAQPTKSPDSNGLGAFQLGLFDYTRATQLISWAVYFLEKRGAIMASRGAPHWGIFGGAAESSRGLGILELNCRLR